MAPLTINGNRVHLSSIPPPGPDEETDFILVETTHRLRPDEESQLQSLGVQGLRRDSDLVLLCRFSPPVAQLPGIEALPFVTHAVVYHSELVVNPEVWAVCSDSDSATAADNNNRCDKTGTQQAGGCGDASSTQAQAKATDNKAKSPIRLAIHTHLTPEGGEDIFKHIQEHVSPDAKLICYSERRAVVEMDRLDKAAVQSIARLDYVASINLYRAARPHSAFATRIIAPANLTWMRPGPGPVPYRFDGDGQTIAVIDSGLGDGLNFHPAFGTALAPRVLAVVNSIPPTPPNPEVFSDAVGHGTEVACCACGDYSVPLIPNSTRTMPIRSGRGATPAAIKKAQEDAAAKNLCRDVRGSAPRAKLVMIRAMESPKVYSVEPTVDMSLPSIQAYNPKIFNFSMSAETKITIGGKDALRLTPYRDVDAEGVDHAANQDNLERVIVYSAGNEGLWPTESDLDPTHVSWRQITTEPAAKNCITVGATCNDRMQRTMERSFGDPTTDLRGGFVDNKDVGNDQQTVDGWNHIAIKDDAGGLASFWRVRVSNELALLSSKGPTCEGRIKPDVVAPGSMILAVRSPKETTRPIARPSEDSYHSCKPPFDEFSFSNGTSLAAPMVAGIAANLRQALKEVRAENAPSGALIKAMIVNGAIDLGGTKEHTSMLWYNPETELTFRFQMAPAPNCAQGFGMVNLDRSLRHVRNEYGGYIDTLKLTPAPPPPLTVPTQTHNINLPPHSGGPLPTNKMLRVTLVWTDGVGAAMNNALHFSATYFPTAIGSAAITVGRDATHEMPWQAHDIDHPDPQDEPYPNVQRISIADPYLYRDFSVTVSTNGLALRPYIDASGGVGRVDQPFALAWSLFDQGT